VLLLKLDYIDPKILLELSGFITGLVKYCQTQDSKGNLEDAQAIGG
jgi:hypothetical protein